MLVLLVGPKGSGKSHIGRLIETRLGVPFFHVEPLWMAYHAACRAEGREPDLVEGIRRIHPKIVKALAELGSVCVETTGASREILDDLLRIGEQVGIVRIAVEAPLDLCLDRIASRDPRHQIPMDEDGVRTVHRLFEELTFPFDLRLRNVDLTADEAVGFIQPFIVSA
ncbi:MAG TPA: AAA family ATPase [Rhodothermales bacterium]